MREESSDLEGVHFEVIENGVIERGVAPERAVGADPARPASKRPDKVSISIDRDDSEISEIPAEVHDRVVISLLRENALSRSGLRESIRIWKQQGEREPLWRVLARHPRVDRERIRQEAARIYAFRQAELEDGTPDPDFVKRFLETVPELQRESFRTLHLLPVNYRIDPDRGVLILVLATSDPSSPETLRFVHDLKIEKFELCYAPESEILPRLESVLPKKNEYLDRLAEDTDAGAKDIGATFEESGNQLVDEAALDAEINRSGLINLVEAALIEAVRQGASDIHVFPNPQRHTEFHFRIDGEMQLWHAQTKVSPEAMLAVVKDRCGNIDRFEREAAQDGFIQRQVDDTLIRYRVSVLPIASSNRDIKAESIVIRVLDDRKVFNDLSQVGLLSGALEKFSKAIALPHGMVIMTGPTGSGKSTTLVAALHQVVRPQVNVLTVEDPVEYIINGVRQIKLGPRLNMEGALRSILRHDPDVVMVGEMRDKETAELAIKLANTGHLTFSTLHTNDAPSAVSRLYKMGIEPFLLAYAINIVMAQRLIRMVCSDCKEIDNDPDIVLMKQLGFTDKEIEEGVFYRAGSDEHCRTCKGVGYKGRRAIAEALYFSRDIRHIIVESGETVNEDLIRSTAIKEGMLTLTASAREVVKMGQTTVEEVMRVTAADE